MILKILLQTPVWSLRNIHKSPPKVFGNKYLKVHFGSLKILLKRKRKEEKLRFDPLKNYSQKENVWSLGKYSLKVHVWSLGKYP